MVFLVEIMFYLPRPIEVLEARKAQADAGPSVESCAAWLHHRASFDEIYSLRSSLMVYSLPFTKRLLAVLIERCLVTSRTVSFISRT